MTALLNTEEAVRGENGRGYCVVFASATGSEIGSDDAWGQGQFCLDFASIVRHALPMLRKFVKAEMSGYPEECKFSLVGIAPEEFFFLTVLHRHAYLLCFLSRFMLLFLCLNTALLNTLNKAITIHVAFLSTCLVLLFLTSFPCNQHTSALVRVTVSKGEAERRAIGHWLRKVLIEQ